jgi:hypothetical protein
MLAVIFFAVIAISTVMVIAARKGLGNTSIGDQLVGSRSFPAWLLCFYSIGTMSGCPAGCTPAERRTASGSSVTF